MTSQPQQQRKSSGNSIRVTDDVYVKLLEIKKGTDSFSSTIEDLIEFYERNDRGAMKFKEGYDAAIRSRPAPTAPDKNTEAQQ